MQILNSTGSQCQFWEARVLNANIEKHWFSHEPILREMPILRSTGFKCQIWRKKLAFKDDSEKTRVFNDSSA